MVTLRMRNSMVALVIMFSPLAAGAFNLPGLPVGMCPLDAKVEAERVVLDYMKTANAEVGEVVSVFGDCNELKALAAGKRAGLAHYGSILRQNQMGGLNVSRADYLSTTAKLYTSNPNLINAAVTSARDATGAATSETGLTTAQKLNATSTGVLHQDANILVMGLAQYQTIGGKQVSVSSIVGLTLINGEPISINLYAPGQEANAQNQSVASLTRYSATLVAANSTGQKSAQH